MRTDQTNIRKQQSNNAHWVSILCVFFSHLFQGYSLMRQQLFRIEIERVV